MRKKNHDGFVLGNYAVYDINWHSWVALMMDYWNCVIKNCNLPISDSGWGLVLSIEKICSSHGLMWFST